MWAYRWWSHPSCRNTSCKRRNTVLAKTTEINQTSSPVRSATFFPPHTAYSWQALKEQPRLMAKIRQSWWTHSYFRWPTNYQQGNKRYRDWKTNDGRSTRCLVVQENIITLSRAIDYATYFCTTVSYREYKVNSKREDVFRLVFTRPLEI